MQQTELVLTYALQVNCNHDFALQALECMHRAEMQTGFRLFAGSDADKRKSGHLPRLGEGRILESARRQNDDIGGLNTRSEQAIDLVSGATHQVVAIGAEDRTTFGPRDC